MAAPAVVATAVVVNRRGGDGGDGSVFGQGFDENGDGKMNASEMNAMRRARGEEALHKLREFDKDGDGGAVQVESSLPIA
jgi:hypothetical protein